MQNKTMDGALLAPRRQIIRNQGERLEHVDALCPLRGAPGKDLLPPKKADVAR